MGLDMYAFTTNQTDLPEVDAKLESPALLHDWRKHPDLHGWMGELYYTKGGQAASFNCVTVRLNPADLDLLEAAIKGKKLPDTVGFFFGNSDGSEDPDDLEFIAKARAAIAQGLAVYYDSWW